MLSDYIKWVGKCSHNMQSTAYIYIAPIQLPPSPPHTARTMAHSWTDSSPNCTMYITLHFTEEQCTYTVSMYTGALYTGEMYTGPLFTFKGALCAWAGTKGLFSIYLFISNLRCLRFTKMCSNFTTSWKKIKKCWITIRLLLCFNSYLYFLHTFQFNPSSNY